MLKDYDNWKYLPDLLLEEIFKYLTWRERLNAACTCKIWYQTFFNPSLWKSFIYKPPTYLEKYNQRIYYDIATFNLSNCFKAVGNCFKKIVIPSMTDFFILNRTLNVICNFYRCQRHIDSFSDADNPLGCDISRLEEFSFEFASQIENGNIYGTGGALFESIKRLLNVLKNLKVINVRALLLELSDRHGLFDTFIRNNRDSLIKLNLVDIGKTPLCEYGLVQLHNLTFLEIGVHELDGDLLVHLVQETRLRELVLTQTHFSFFYIEFSTMTPISNHVWELVVEINPDLKVIQKYIFNNISEFLDLTTITMIYQLSLAPVRTFFFSSINTSLLDLHKLELYHSTLRELIIIIDCEEESTRSSYIDEQLLQIIYICPHLETVVLGGRNLYVYSATILQLLLEGSRTMKYMFIEDRVVRYSLQNMSTNLFNSYVSKELIAMSMNPDQFIAKVRSQLQLSKWNLMNNKQFFTLIKKKNML